MKVITTKVKLDGAVTIAYNGNSYTVIPLPTKATIKHTSKATGVGGKQHAWVINKRAGTFRAGKEGESILFIGTQAQLRAQFPAFKRQRIVPARPGL